MCIPHDLPIFVATGENKFSSEYDHITLCFLKIFINIATLNMSSIFGTGALTSFFELTHMYLPTMFYHLRNLHAKFMWAYTK